MLAFGGSLLWMPVVYRRYQLTVALPIEYGAVNAGAVLVGVLHEYSAVCGAIASAQTSLCDTPTLVTL